MTISTFFIFLIIVIAVIVVIKLGFNTSGTKSKTWTKIAYKHFDYIVCRTSDLAVVCAVELNDQSHSTKRARKRDELIEGVCKVISLPLMQVTAKEFYSSQEVLDQFIETIKTTIEGNN